MVGRGSIYVVRDSAKKEAVVKRAMHLQAISLPVPELSACRRDSCCLQLVGLSVSELNHELRFHFAGVKIKHADSGDLVSASGVTLCRERERERERERCALYGRFIASKR